MTIEYCDKDGKKHQMKLDAVTLHFSKGNTGDPTSIEIKETKRFNPVTEQFEPTGVAQVSPPHGGHLVTCVHNQQLLMTVGNRTFKGILI